MTKKNFYFNIINLHLLILYINIFGISFSFPFINLQSEQLNNGNFLMVHQYGIDICNEDLSQKIRTEIIFSEDEQISNSQQMKDVIIRKFDDGYLVCLINKNIYIFNSAGQFLNKKENINNGKTVDYYTISIHDNYHFYIGYMAQSVLNIFYYEFNHDSNEIKIKAESGDLTNSEGWWLWTTEYTFQNNGFDCHIINDISKGEALACFFITSNSNIYYWNIEFLYVNGNSIEQQTSYSSIRKEMSQNCPLFKVEVNSDKTKALICGFNGYSDFCFYYYTSQSDLELNYITPGGSSCSILYYAFKVNYFQDKNEFAFSCLINDNNIKYVVYNLDDESNSNNNIYSLRTQNNCEKFNGYSLFYSNEKENYFIVSDYICDKSLDISEEEDNDDGYECGLEKCLTCDEFSKSENLCKKCNTTKGYYPLKNSVIINSKYKDCFNDRTKPINYFLNIVKKYYEACYATCKKCDFGGDNINNNCTECDFGYIFLPGLNNTFNCVMKCPFYFYYTIDGQYKCSSSSICPEDYYLLIREKGQCVKDCSSDNEYKYQYDGECYKQCPNNSRDNNDNICVDNSIDTCSLSKKEINFINEKISEEELEKLAKSYVKEFAYTDKHISLFNYFNYEIDIYKNYECISDLSLEIPSVDLGECYEKIQMKYNIEDKLIFSILSQRTEDAKYPVIISFYIYSPYTGVQLNLTDVCEDEGINIEEDISMKIEDKEKYDYVQYLSQQNIDVFNLSSDFYKDTCYYFISPVKKDIALKDRIKIFFPNITLCENGCNIKSINSTTMKAECECKLNNLINNNALANNAFYKSQVGNIEEFLSQSNLEILKCGSSILKHLKLTSFIGSFIFLAFILCQIILSIIYFSLSIKPLKKFINDIIELYIFHIKKHDNFPPKKSSKDKRVKFANNTKKGKNVSSNKSKIKINFTEINKESNAPKTDISMSKKTIKNSSSKTITKIHKNKMSNKDIKIHALTNKQIKYKDKIKHESAICDSNIILSSKNDFNINIEEYIETDIDTLPFEEVIEIEKRKYCEYFSEQLKSNLLSINICCGKDPLKPTPIKILLYIITIELYLFINALFINEDFISEIYHSEENNFFNFLPRSLDRVFYATIVKVLVAYISDCFFIEEKKIRMILKSKRSKPKEKKIKLKEVLNITLNRFIFFIIFSFIITLFALYYITCFNYRYYYITDEWIKSSVFIIASMEMLSILTIFMESSLRFISFRINSEKIYKLSLFFS